MPVFAYSGPITHYENPDALIITDKSGTVVFRLGMDGSIESGSQEELAAALRGISGLVAPISPRKAN